MNLQGYLDLAAARVWGISHRPTAASRTRSVVLSAGQLRQLEADLECPLHQPADPRPSLPARGASTVVAGVTVDDLPVTLVGSCRGEFAGVGRYWVPNPLTRDTIKSLAGPPPQR